MSYQERTPKSKNESYKKVTKAKAIKTHQKDENNTLGSKTLVGCMKHI